MDGVPVSNEFLGPGVEVAGALVGEEHDGQGHEEHHVTGQDEEDDQAKALEEFARAIAAHLLPFIVVTVAAAAGGTTVKRGLTADARIFAFGVDRISSECGIGMEDRPQ